MIIRENLAGFVSINSLGLFLGDNDFFQTRNSSAYYDIIGYREKEILTAFGSDIDNAASRILSKSKIEKKRRRIDFARWKCNVRKDQRANKTGY